MLRDNGDAECEFIGLEVRLEPLHLHGVFVAANERDLDFIAIRAVGRIIVLVIASQ